ncbi:hypothetical protein HPB49_022204 [Dermacentor silvarum]|uniref:Uncharacterized protein n=1 Tax=Dermacentor silvarum TaxID=543639 RepID=A0ACB8CHP1_DERSI|nr:hypothetical protein HPB49_022204 [Dermacentor silvarum]
MSSLPSADRFLVGSVMGLVIGGTFTTTSAIHWHLLNFSARPDTVQARVQQEIDEVVGTERAPTWEDRQRMPYTLACICELERWKTLSPLGAVRVTSDNLVAEGVFIPKDTVVVFNMWAVHNDTSYWKDPYCFNPCRFLNKDGSILSQKPPYWMPFSVGRRSCPGEAFATLEIFLFLTLVLQKFRVLLETPLQYDLDDPRIDFPIFRRFSSDAGLARAAGRSERRRIPGRSRQARRPAARQVCFAEVEETPSSTPAIKGILYNAVYNQSQEEIFEGLVALNPSRTFTIADARQLGRTKSILVTFINTTEVPRQLNF